MYTAIKIEDNSYKFRNKDGTEEGEINGLNKINIFVGQNNSGKSRFMRSIFSNEIFYKETSFTKTNKFLQSTGTEIKEWVKSMGFGSHFQYGDELLTLNKNYCSEKEYIYTQILTILGKIKDGLNNSSSRIGPMTFGQVNTHIDGIVSRNISECNINTEELKDKNSKKVYIPMLRGLKNPIAQEFKRDIFEERTIYDYFCDVDKEELDTALMYEEFSKKGFEIFTGLSLYEDIKRMLLGNHKERAVVRDFEIFLSKNFFENQAVTLTPHIDDDVLYVKIGDNSEDFPIYDLGDGIQSIIINTFPLYKYKDENLLLFAEEPEVGIHPGMQRILLNTFASGIQSDGCEHQIYFTTHSNHFLDIALDNEVNDKISIFQFNDTDREIEKDGKKYFEKDIKNITQNKEILNLLGVQNSSVFLSNSIIWVEGISDRIYIKKFLELYQNEQKRLDPKFKIFEEDKHFSILEYAGGNITHFEFSEESDEDKINVSALNKNNFLLADNDLSKPGDKKYIRLDQLKDILGEDNIYYDFPEIENLITYDIWKKYFDNYEGNNWEKRTSGCWTQPTFEKNIYEKNIGIILKKTFIGLKDSKISKKFDDGKDISIIGKKDLVAERVIELIDNYSDLSEKSKKLIEKIYKFIESNNS